jgi:hypothetical protein
MLELDLFVAKSSLLCQAQSSRIRGECDGWVLGNESRLIEQLTSLSTEGGSLQKTPIRSCAILPYLEEVRKAADLCTTWGGALVIQLQACAFRKDCVCCLLVINVP